MTNFEKKDAIFALKNHNYFLLWQWYERKITTTDSMNNRLPPFVGVPVFGPYPMTILENILGFIL